MIDAHNKLHDQALINGNAGDNYYLIDCPPSAQSPQIQQALEIADLAIVPVLPSPLDIWATVQIEETVSQAQLTNPNLRVMLVINQYESRTRLSRLMQRALEEISLPSAATIIRRRAVYRHAFLEGRTVHDMGSSGRAAAEEINQLVSEMEQHL